MLVKMVAPSGGIPWAVSGVTQSNGAMEVGCASVLKLVEDAADELAAAAELDLAWLTAEALLLDELADEEPVLADGLLAVDELLPAETLELASEADIALDELDTAAPVPKGFKTKKTATMATIAIAATIMPMMSKPFDLSPLGGCPWY